MGLCPVFWVQPKGFRIIIRPEAHKDTRQRDDDSQTKSQREDENENFRELHASERVEAAEDSLNET